MQIPLTPGPAHLGRGPISRKRFLELALAGVATGVMVGSGVRPSRAAAAAPESAHDLGIHPSNSGAVNRQKLLAVLAYKSTSVTFPPGDYLLDNVDADGKPSLIINNFTGTLDMQAGARLIYTNPSQGGLYFYYKRYSPGARLTGVNATYATLPTVRNSMANITFDGAISPTVERLTVNGATGGGLGFWGCLTPYVNDATISNTMADGVHFANCQDGYANLIRCTNTGDDGLAFVNYDGDKLDNNTGGSAYNISVTGSKARGIAVIAQSGVTIDHFGVNWSAGAGILVGHDKYGSRVPTNVTFSNGFVYHGGGLEVDPVVGNRFGIDFEGVGEVFYHNINVRDSFDRGMSGTAHKDQSGGTPGTVHISQVSIERSGTSGANLYGGTYRITDVDEVPPSVDKIPGLAVTDSADIGVWVSKTDLFQYGTMTATNTSKTRDLHRAFDFEENLNIQGTRLRVNDDQNPATGYIVGAYRANSGNLGTINHAVAHLPAGAPLVQNQSPSSLGYTQA